jgi:hypothetical protein
MQEKAMRARVAGHEKMEACIAWWLEIGPLRLRCVKQADGSFVVQCRNRDWNNEVKRGANAGELLRDMVNSKGVASLLPRDAVRTTAKPDAPDRA